MEIEFILFHSQLSRLQNPATGEIGLIMLEKGVTRQLPGLHRLPGAAVFTAGLIPVAGES
jgi:hypothetical protein